MALGPNPLEIVLMILLGSGFGIPPGVPPAEEAPLAAKIAPAECLFYATWAGTGTPDANSTNQTEQLLSEKEIQTFLTEGRKRMFGFWTQAAGRQPEAQENIKNITKLLDLIRGKPGALYITDLKLADFGVSYIEGGALLQLGDQTDEVVKLLEKMQSKMAKEEVSTIKIGSRPFHRIKAGEEYTSVTWGAMDDYLVVGLGDGSLEALVKRSQGESPGWLTDIRKKLSVPRFSSLFYVDVKRLIKLVTEKDDLGEIQKGLSILGLDKIGHFASVAGMDDKGCVSRALLSVDGKPTGLLSWIDAKPLSAKDLAPVDSDALTAVVFKCDTSELFEMYMKLINFNNPRGDAVIQTQLDLMKEHLGIDVREDFVNALGDTLRLYVQPTGPAAIINGWTLAVDVRKRDNLKRFHDTWLKMIEAGLAHGGGDTPTLTTGRKINGREVYTLDFTHLGAPFTPSWCFTDDKFFLAATFESLERLLTNDDKQSLALQPDVAPLVAKDAKTLALAYVDTREITESILPKLPELLAAMGPETLEPRISMMLDTSMLPSSKIFAAHLQPCVFSARRTKDGLELVSRRTLPGLDPGTMAPAAVAALLPAVSSARGAARRAHSMNNLRQLAISLHQHEAAQGAFPAGYSADEKGKPLLSWRVHILPYIEHQELYDQFHLNEPWDSPHNKKLIDKMPAVFRSAASKAKKPGMTNYLGVGGADGIFVRPAAGGKFGSKMRDVTDGLSNTIMMIEVPDKMAVIWTKPADFAPDKKNPTKGLAGLHPDGFTAGFADGSVRFYSKEIDADTFRALLTKSGGEVIDPDNF